MCTKATVLLTVYAVSLALGGAACRFDSGGLTVTDGGVPTDGPGSTDGSGLQDADPTLDAGPGIDGQIQQDGQVQQDAGPTTCVEANCDLGCNLVADRCNRLMPSNFSPQGWHIAVTAGLSCVDGEHVYIDTDNGEIIGNSTYRPGDQPGTAQNGIYWDIVPQTNAPALTVIGVTHLDIPAGCNVYVNGGRVIAFYVIGDVLLDGYLGAYGYEQAAGPGGSLGGAANGDNGAPCVGAPGQGGEHDDTGSAQYQSGGGGGGLGGDGGDGGSSNPGSATGGDAGVPNGVPVTLSPLPGGCGGGAGGGPDTNGNYGDGGYGGMGGGGIQISAGGYITIGPTSGLDGGIDAGGGEGQGGQNGAGGGGGGSGGAILLEAAAVDNGGLLAANGGGGGAGAPYLTSHGIDGEAGLFEQERSEGGAGENAGGSGGSGGAEDDPDGNNGSVDINGGGAGGSAGLIRINYDAYCNPGATSPDNISEHQGLSVW